MKFLRWVRGRQPGSYYKMALFPQWLSILLNADLYILKFPQGCSVMKHTDPVMPGYSHYRMNIRLSGKDRMYINGPIKRFGCIDMFRPDLYEHGLTPISTPMIMISAGCRIKVRSS